MRDLAVSLGVPAHAIRLDRHGLNTSATVTNTPAGRVLAVSHGYHLPRIKLAYQQRGLTCYTVPARETRTLAAMPWFVMREVAAIWFYYARPLV